MIQRCVNSNGKNQKHAVLIHDVETHQPTSRQSAHFLLHRRSQQEEIEQHHICDLENIEIHIDVSVRVYG